MKSSTKRKLHFGGGIWLLALLLLLLIIATELLLGALVRNFAGGEKNVISLFPGDKIDPEKNYVSGYTPNDSLTVYKPSNPFNPDEKIPTNANWESTTSVDLFKTTYTNDRGEVVVESSNGDPIIAPGTHNDYSFSLKNNGNIALEYDLTLDGLFSYEQAKLPFVVRLRCGDEWLVGDEDTWVSPESLKGTTLKGTLARGKYVSYTLQWQWPFESDDIESGILNDINDSLIGNAAAGDDLNFSLNIGTVSRIANGAVPVDASANPIMTAIYAVPAPIYIGIFLVALPVLLFAFIVFMLYKRSIYFVGHAPSGSVVVRLRHAYPIGTDGRFSFGKILCGRQHWTLKPSKDSTARFDKLIIRRSRHLQGIALEKKDNATVIRIGKTVQAVEVYFAKKGDRLFADRSNLAAIDSMHNVHTEDGIIPPDEKGNNKTTGGLTVTSNGKFEEV